MENEPHDTLSIELEKLGVEHDRIPDPPCRRKAIRCKRQSVTNLTPVP